MQQRQDTASRQRTGGFTLRAGGFTLVESLVALAVAAILFSAALPNLGGLAQRNESEVATRQLVHSWEAGRSAAITLQHNIVICGSNDGSRCEREWRHYILIFRDDNGDLQADDHEIVQRQSFTLRHGYFVTRLALSREQFQVNTRGRPNLTGSLIYCPDTAQAPLIQRLTWNRAGRLYRGQDKDQDGITDDTDGSPMHCTAAT
jgi:prepilin-type N-terminal cleavage/methylation domain-containing protein